MELHTLQPEPQVLFVGRIAVQLDLPTGADDALPGQGVESFFAQELCDCPVIERITCRRGHFAVGRDFPLRDRTNDAAEGSIALLVFAKGVLDDTSLQVLR